MNTEITDINKSAGIILYDAQCPACHRLAARWQSPLARRGFNLVPLQTPSIQTRFHLSEAVLLTEMHLIRADGVIFVGADAWLEISRPFWWTWPARQLARLPAIKKWFHRTYRWIARHRYCLQGYCRIDTQPTAKTYRTLDFLPLLAFAVSALLLRPHVANWIFMWVMAFGLYAGCKWLTYQTARRQISSPPRRRLGYLFAYTGMNAAEFLAVKRPIARPRHGEWIDATLKILSGMVFLYAITPRLHPAHPLAAGWIGMVGIILILHFGLFHLLALAWQRVGVAALPLMQNPSRATSLAEFWGRRWNTGFKELAYQLLFRPLHRRTNRPAFAHWMVFGFSGLIHELVISLPARGGYGLPTLYFLLQGGGILLERTAPAKKLGLGRGWCGRVFTMLLTIGPVFLLFHPPFIRRVILPMLQVLGAT